MPKQKSKSSVSRQRDRATPDSLVNMDHNESSGLLHPTTSQSTTDSQLPVPGTSSVTSSVTSARYGSTPLARKPSVASNSSSSWKLKYQDFMPTPHDTTDAWTNTESFQSV